MVQRFVFVELVSIFRETKPCKLAIQKFNFILFLEKKSVIY